MRNEALEKAKSEYALVEGHYVEKLKEKGLRFTERGVDDQKCARLRSRLREILGEDSRAFRNSGSSISLGHLSLACVECTGANGSETFSTTFKCHRDCYFCFNRNLKDYDKFVEEGCPWEEQLDACAEEDRKLACIGLTGGEPLLDFEGTVRFLQRVSELYPDAHKRMYTSGDLLTREMAEQLRDSGLDEIRFSVKNDDSREMQEKVLDKMRLAKGIIPSTMVEMPVLPGSLDYMKDLILKFADAGIDGVNLLEFCFPFCNWEAFESRGFELRNPPFEIMYDYGYSGGLAVSGSEEVILELLIWAACEDLPIGLHYCSLENKHRSEIRIKNDRFSDLDGMFEMDEGDFFLKAAKLFGCDIDLGKKALIANGCDVIVESKEEDSIAFPLSYLHALDGIEHPDGSKLQPQVCSFVYECDEEGSYLIDVAIADVQH